MCGIMGYIGNRSAKQIIYTGLKQMEYRGYDSAGIALLDDEVTVSKAVGDTSKLDLETLPETPTFGIGHTRWATHGKPSTKNAHPHIFGDTILVHNGIIDNYEDLKELIDSSKLKSDTDSEVLAGLIDKYYSKDTDLLHAVQTALSLVKGTFGVVIMSPKEPRKMIVARRGSPIVIGVGDEQFYTASDPTAIVNHTDKVVYLKDDQIALITDESIDIYDIKLKHQDVAIEVIDEHAKPSELGRFKSFLEKEIFEQPKSLTDLMRGRVSDDGTIMLGGPNLSAEDINNIKHIVIVGCGTAFYAGYYAKYKLEELLGIQVSVEQASEFRYRHGAYDPETSLAIFMSQSGETADTLASVKEAKRRHIKTMGIINTVGSTIAREVDYGGIYLHAGVEVSVASTKAYSSMVSALLMFGGYLADKRGENSAIIRSLAQELTSLPDEVRATLRLKNQIDKIAGKLGKFHDWYYLGRNEFYPVAIEGALKNMEISYVHSQGLASGEMKHGYIALASPKHLSILLLPEDKLLYEKSILALEELKARGGKVFTISTRPKEKHADYHIEVAHIGQYTDGLIYNVVLQLLALAIAEGKKLDIDKPRNLAKSVTVE